MRIGINCLSIKPKYVGGVTSFTFGIIDGLVQNKNDGFSYQIYLNKYNHNLFKKYKNIKNVELYVFEEFFLIKKIISNICLLILSEKLFRIINKFLFKSLDSFTDSKSDIIYTTSPTLISYGNIKPTLVSMHDIQHLHYPKYFNIITRRHRSRNYLYTAKSAKYLQASSNFIKNDFLFHYPFLNRKKILVLNEGVLLDDFIIVKEEAIKSFSKLKLPEDFIFYPSQLWHHKDHATILKALQVLRDKHSLNINLVLSGGKFSASKSIFKLIDDLNLNDQVYYLGKVPFKTLLSLYSLSRFFITATLYESSSLPALEAASVGTAIIASDTPPNKEMGQNIRMNLFKSKNVKSLSNKILEIWHNKELREDQIDYNKNAVKNYSWNKIALKYKDYFINNLRNN